MGDLMLYGFWTVILYGVFIWVFLNPEESLIIFRRWRYERDPDFSDLAININKSAVLFGILFIPLIICSLDR